VQLLPRRTFAVASGEEEKLALRRGDAGEEDKNLFFEAMG